jgi:hypothetical protein
VTVHFVDEGVDSGPIVCRKRFELPYHRDIAADRAALPRRRAPAAAAGGAADRGGRVSLDPTIRELVRVDAMAEASRRGGRSRRARCGSGARS